MKNFVQKSDSKNGTELDKTIYLSVQIKGNIFITTKKNGGFQHEKQRIQKNVSSNNGRNNDNEYGSWMCKSVR